MKIDSPNAIGISTGFGIPTGGTTNQSLVKTGSTDYETAWITTINDQSSSGYIDIGNVRYQWGVQTGNENGLGTTSFPASFADTNYAISMNIIGAPNGSIMFSSISYGKTTTSFQWILRYALTGTATPAGDPFNWIAIGLKP